ncbi:CLK4-associating serine/arginine rich protein [Nymphon striatum]|nr:CLK4-associating serine/arginine rich protein [Nymphon striatum]
MMLNSRSQAKLAKKLKDRKSSVLYDLSLSKREELIMWHEARKQEKKIRGLMVDYKRRAERRRNFYERIKADPTQFMQIHGRPYKIHLDPSIAQAADSPANMMPWQGDKTNLIDRFDVRAHLDYISEYKLLSESEKSFQNFQHEDRQANYERYRILVQSDFLAITEEKFLNQIFLEERYGPINRASEEEKKKLVDKKAAIGYVYEDSMPANSTTNAVPVLSDDEDKDDDSDIDLDMAIEFDQLTVEQQTEMNAQSLKYGMEDKDFVTYMEKDKEEAEALRQARELEEEKAMYSGRKSRRERRAFREKRLAGRKISPPSYAAKKSPTYEPYPRSVSRSKSRSPENCGQITFITSFGDELDPDSQTKKSSGKKIVQEKRKNMDLKGQNHLKALQNLDLGVQDHQDKDLDLPDAQDQEVAIRLSIQIPKEVQGDHPLDLIGLLQEQIIPEGIDLEHQSYLQEADNIIPVDTGLVPLIIVTADHLSIVDMVVPEGQIILVVEVLPMIPEKALPRKIILERRVHLVVLDLSLLLLEVPADQNHQSLLLNYHKKVKVKANRNLRHPDLLKGIEETAVPYLLKAIQILIQVMNRVAQSFPKTGNASAVGGIKGKLTPQERLKRKMQLALNKQYKADKVAEQRKILKQEKMQKAREDELREMSIKLRRKDRERRHKLRYRHERSSSSSSSSSRSRSFSRSRSRSQSPISNY